ncbi:MAG TPA: chromosomal replication initiator protein DnaA [Candidatus Limnocylindrales bacterium]|nr:chromosomal replication initiator protein DnaA [Candidatus Limnocylindrales bacterium]
MNPNLWENILKHIADRINRQSFETWFRPVRPLSFESGTIKLGVPDQNFISWLNEHYLEVLLGAIKEVMGELPAVSFVVYKESDEAKNSEVSSFPSSREMRERQMELPTPIETPYRKNPSRVFEESEEEVALNPRYTFSTYVVGSGSRFAHAASLAVAEQMSSTYNPLFIYGGVGLGKTHLLHAIGHKTLGLRKKVRLLYISSERFVNELINSIRYDSLPSFREKYRQIDFLLIDDIQFIAGKDRTQEEFFHTFNALHNARKQIVITSDCPPKQIPTLEERLRSRFEWGLIADIQPPDLETKIAILQKKAEERKVHLPDEVALFIASKVKSNIRELEGCLTKVAASAAFKGCSINLELAQEVLQDLFDTKVKPITVDLVQKVVANYYQIPQQELKAQTRVKNIAFPRQVAMYLCRELTQLSLPEIGRSFGGKDHTTILHACRKIEQEMSKNPELRGLINKLKNLIQS